MCGCWLHSPHPVNPCQSLLILVDIRSVGTRRVNSLRQIIDDCGEGLKYKHLDIVNKRVLEAAGGVAPSDAGAMDTLKAAIEGTPLLPTKHIVVCVLIPATWIGIRDPYPALFLNGWAFSYLDSYSEAAGSITAASWMRVKCGLQEGFTPTCARSLRGLNRNILRAVALKVNGNRSSRHFLAITGHNQHAKGEYIALENFYMDPPTRLATTADRVAALERLEGAMGGETLASLLAFRFLSLFPKATIVEQLEVGALFVAEVVVGVARVIVVVRRPLVFTALCSCACRPLRSCVPRVTPRAG